MPILAQDFKVLNGCDQMNGKSGAIPGSAGIPACMSCKVGGL